MRRESAYTTHASVEIQFALFFKIITHHSQLKSFRSLLLCCSEIDKTFGVKMLSSSLAWDDTTWLLLSALRRSKILPFSESRISGEKWPHFKTLLLFLTPPSKFSFHWWPQKLWILHEKAERERESTCFGMFMRNRHPQISQHSDDNVWQVKEKPGLPEGNWFLGVWSALYDSLYHQISNHNTELPAVPSPQTSTHNCRGLSCSHWFISNVTSLIPVLQLPSHSHPIVTKPSASSLCPVLCVSTHFCSGIFTKFCFCHSPLHCCLAFVVLVTPKGILFQSCSGVPHCRLQYLQILHLLSVSDPGIKISQ